jgi:PBP1b-binding outer membrane lipoprotein LpoB
MMPHRLFYLIAICVVVLVSCSSEQKPVAEDNVWPRDTTEAATAMDISHIKTVLPQAGNVALVESYCMPCHSLRYIEMQPEFTYKAWEKIVDKMITAYGAPVRDSATRQDIINYLYAIKGKKE